MILDDKYITKDMLTKNSYKGNYYAKKNAVMYDLQNGKQNVVCFCDNIYTAQGIVEGLNMLDKLEADGVELKSGWACNIREDKDDLLSKKIDAQYYQDNKNAKGKGKKLCYFFLVCYFFVAQCREKRIG